MEQRNLETALEQSFLDYSAFVLQRRALPDARDGMKYTARQILHAQLKEGLVCTKKFKKSQKSVSAATAFSYVHGDTSCYEQIIRMGRKYVQRYFLEDIVGNAGQPNASSSYSAARYTEAALSRLGMTIMEYLDSDTLDKDDWSPTYDETGYFPTVFPSVGFYGLCNGSFGSIGVGLISSIPQFNLRELNDVIIKLIDWSQADFELYPDFASGGILLNPKTTLNSLNKGEGKSAILRAHIKKYPKEGYLEVIDLPYGVYTNTVCGELGEAISKGGSPVTEFKDLTQKGVQIRIYGKDLDALEQWLYKNTSIQKHFTIKLIMLDGGKVPKLFTLREALLAHINHASKVLRRKYEYDLKKLKERAHILEGYIKAFSVLDQVIALIRASQDRADAITKLVKEIELTQIQAAAVVDLKLHRLSNMDIQKVKNEYDQNMAEQQVICNILNNKTVFNNKLIDRYKEVAEQFGDERRTELDMENIIDVGEDDVPQKDFYLDSSFEEYHAVYWEDPDFDASSYLPMFLDADYVFITDRLRGFTAQGKSLKIGQHKWQDIFKALKTDETIVGVFNKPVANVSKYLILQDEKGETYSWHSSFLNRATPRGKLMTTKKYSGMKLIDISDTPDGNRGI